MTSKSSTAAKRAIQEMGASLFYAKLRGEDIGTYENLSGKENFAGNNNLNGEVISSSEEKLGSKEILSGHDNLAASKVSINKGNKSGNDKVATKENLSGYEYLPSEEKLSNIENLSSDVKGAGEENLTGRMPLPYDSPLLAFISEIGLSGVCIAIVLRHLLPAEGGKIRIGALSRSLNMSSNNIRLHLETLQAKGVIASSNGDQQGRMIRFLHPFLRSQGGVDFFAEKLDGDYHPLT